MLSVATSFYSEAGRPQFHFTAKTNWLNDPNGLVYHAGEYHLFFQHNPRSKRWGNMTWGHAVSQDLLHWRQLKHAIHPDNLGHPSLPGDAWSGSAVVDVTNSSGLQRQQPGQGHPPLVALFTHSPAGVERGPFFPQRLAFSRNGGRTWHKLKEPVLPSQPCPTVHSLVGCAYARDPKVEWHEQSGQWIMALYLENHTYGLYGSKDLRHWHVLHNGVITVRGAKECPDLFQLPVGSDIESTSLWVLWTGVGVYALGTFDGQRFRQTQNPRRGEYGTGYAGQTFSSEPWGRRIQMSWLRGCVWGDGVPFSEQMTFPVLLDLVRLPSDRGLRIRRLPVPEIASKRRLPALVALRHEDQHVWLQPYDHTNISASGFGFGLDVNIRAGIFVGADLLLHLLGNDVIITFRGGSIGHVRTWGQYHRPIEFAMPLFAISSSAETVDTDQETAATVEIRILLDRRSLEVFDSIGGASMAVCVALPSNSTGGWRTDIQVSSIEKPVRIDVLEIYELNAALHLSPV